MEKQIGIYKITSPKNCIYIGQSHKLNIRKNQYKNGHCSGQRKLVNSIKKYGWENHKFEVIHECLVEELDIWEIYYIKFYDSFNTPKGLNLTSGGNRCTVSEETKKKISDRVKGSGNPIFGKKRSKETIDKIKAANTGRKASQ